MHRHNFFLKFKFMVVIVGLLFIASGAMAKEVLFQNVSLGDIQITLQNQEEWEGAKQQFKIKEGESVKSNVACPNAVTVQRLTASGGMSKEAIGAIVKFPIKCDDNISVAKITANQSGLGVETDAGGHFTADQIWPAAPRTYKITNSSMSTAQIYLTGASYGYVSKGSAGNLAYDEMGKLDPEGKYRTLKPGESTTYVFKEGVRMAFCVQAVMVKFEDQPEFIKAIPLHDISKGCANQNIVLMRRDSNRMPSATGSADVTFNYIEPFPFDINATPVTPPPADPNAPSINKESVLNTIKSR